MRSCVASKNITVLQRAAGICAVLSRMVGGDAGTFACAQLNEMIGGKLLHLAQVGISADLVRSNV